MQVFVDQSVIPCDGQTPLAALHVARVVVQQQERVIIEVRVDGQDWDGDADSPVAGRPAGTVAFRTAGAKELVTSAWHDLSDLVGQIGDSQRAAASKLQSGDVPAAMAELHGVLEAWQVVERGVREGAAILNIEPEELMAMAGRETLLPGLVMELKKIQTAVAEQSWSDLADFLIDEMGEMAGKWQVALGELADKLSGADGSTGTAKG